MPRIFISHSSKDNAFADRLAHALRARGAEVWIDLSDIPAGMKWSSAIQQGLDACELMLLIISPDSMASSNVEDEWQYYLDSKKLLIPVRWIPAKVHFQLGRHQYVDFHQQEFDSALDRLTRELARHGHRLATPPTTTPPIEAPAPTPIQAPPRATTNPFAGVTANQRAGVSPAPASAYGAPLRLPDLATWQVASAKLIEGTLDSFGAPGRVVSTTSGAVVAQFGVEPDYIMRGDKKVRVKVNAISALDKDIAHTLGVPSIRIEAPVPGKGFVGIEVPHPFPRVVRLQDVLDSAAFQHIKSPLVVPIGQTVDGNYLAADLTALPHLLIGGAEGSGKSVFLNALIASLLLKHQPSAVGFAMIAPSGNDLLQFDGIPHLLEPVARESIKGLNLLKSALREMDERYRTFSTTGVRHIAQHNTQVDPSKALPYIVVIIGDLEDLMLAAPDETERVITRLATLSRSTGIHLIIVTQNPSVAAVTGLIKANMPARVALTVRSHVDSRVLLDYPGAERLLGKGDLMYLSGDMPAPVRVQGPFVSDVEIQEITRFWRTKWAAERGTTGQP